jgi:predicted RNA-binding protein with RPS1 domain
VAGLNQAVAKGIIDWRAAKGPFTSREQFREVPGFGDTAFVQAVGFLKISDGINPLDSTRIHPESYQVAERLLEKLDMSSAELVDREKHQKISDAVSNINLNAVADELGVGRLLLADIVEQFVQPGRDPREDLPEPLFKQGVLKFEDLEVGMELRGSVLNVVDFGVFVDIGLLDSGLVHVSQLSSGFIRDPHAAVVVGQAVRVWVLELDKTRRRVALTMIKPGTKPVHGANKGRQQNSKKKSSEGSFQNKPGEPKSLKSGRGRRNSGENEKKGRKQFRGPRTYTSRPDRQSKKAITAEMKTGQEPLRTFGDLKQFFNIQTGVDDVMAESSKKKQKKDSERREADSKETVASNADHGDLGSPLPAVSSTVGKEEKSLVAEAVVKPMPDQDTIKSESDGSAQESSSQVHDSTEVPNEQQSSKGPSEETSQ